VFIAIDFYICGGIIRGNYKQFVTSSLNALERERICREPDINIIYPDSITAMER